MKQDPFLLRAIEHWLVSANELTYQPLFCFWLTTQKYKVKYVIKNTHFELGKDVVAVAQDGTIHAYQLKGGNINLNRWRTEVRPEIEALLDTPIKHPDVPHTLNHSSYLVVNGNIEDNVRVEITELNGIKWRDTPLKIITKGDLLAYFQELSYGILPSDVEEYKKLIDLIFEDGHGLPDLEKITKFLYGILNINRKSVNKAQCERDIASAVLYTNMIVGNYRIASNYASVVQVLTSLASSILYMAEAFELEDKYWKESYDIIWDDIISNAKALESEIITNGFDNNINSPIEKNLFEFRKHAAMSIVWPLKLSECISCDDNWKNILDPKVIDTYTGSNSLWGEASFINGICIASMLMLVPSEIYAAKGLTEVAIERLLEFNGRNSKLLIGLPTPYYTMTVVLNKINGLDPKPFEEKFKLRSYYLGVLIDLLVRLDDKEFLQNHWREISFMRLEEFIPDKKAGYLLWSTKEGVNRTTLLPKQKKWSELTNEANSFKGESLPVRLKRIPEFVPFFMSVFPHRVNRDILGFLHNSAALSNAN